MSLLGFFPKDIHAEMRKGNSQLRQKQKRGKFASDRGKKVMKLLVLLARAINLRAKKLVMLLLLTVENR